MNPIKKYYQDFIEVYQKVRPSLNKQECHNRYDKEWAKLKPDLVMSQILNG